MTFQNNPVVANDILTARAEKAFSFLQETVKQLLTLSTAIFTLTLTFVKNVAPPGTNMTLLEVAWALYLLAIVAGIGTLLTLTGNIERPQSGEAGHSIYTSNIRLFLSCQIGLFLLALMFTLAFGVTAI